MLFPAYAGVNPSPMLEQLIYVFPAHAGVSPHYFLQANAVLPIPHACGGYRMAASSAMGIEPIPRACGGEPWLQFVRLTAFTIPRVRGGKPAKSCPVIPRPARKRKSKPA